MTQKTEKCCECGSMSVEFHKFWLGDLLPMCRRCFTAYMRRKSQVSR